MNLKQKILDVKTNNSDCHNCSDCFQCFSCKRLKNKKYCILNIEFTKEEYSEILKKIQ